LAQATDIRPRHRHRYRGNNSPGPRAAGARKRQARDLDLQHRSALLWARFQHGPNPPEPLTMAAVPRADGPAAGAAEWRL